MTRILITGGSGFIGSWVIDDLRRRYPDVQIRAMDLARVERDDVESHVGSILDVNSVNEAVRGCDFVLHMAAMLGVKKTETKRVECLNANIVGTLNVLDACVKERAKKIVFMSSSEVYGDQATLPISESDPVNPKSVYAITKLVGEEYCRAYEKRYGLNFSIVRFFNVYGPGQVAEFVISKFAMAVRDGDVPTVYGNGEQVRAFNFVEDAARGVVEMLFQDAANGETINIGNDSEPISMRDLAARVLTVAGRPEEQPRFIPMADSDRDEGREIQRRAPDVSKAREVLGFEALVSLDDGLRRVLDGRIIAPSWVDPTNA